MKKSAAEGRARIHWQAKRRQDGSIPPDLLSYTFTDSGNAERLVAAHGKNLRYVHDFRRWLVWDGTRWVNDCDGAVIRAAKKSITTFMDQAIEKKDEAAEKFARQSLDARRIRAMIELAQSEMPVKVVDLDQSLFLLNFLNGTVDLRDGTLREHCREDFITKRVNFNFNPTAECPGWIRFLFEIMGATPDASETELNRASELVNFIQRALGYSLTADVSEKAIFICHGKGDNGKTTMLGIVHALVEEYSASVSLDILTTRDESNNVAASRAELRGARFVTSSETEEGQRFSAVRLKRICQGPGGRIEACRKYENPISFAETHKLWIDANHKPELPASDDAVWNRVRLIPFSRTIPKANQDRKLAAHLIDNESEGILCWLIEGAKKWRSEGLTSGRSVTEATDDWRIESNRLRAFLDERTIFDPGESVGSQKLYDAYRKWCEAGNERPFGIVRFSRQLESLGFIKKKKEHGNDWSGICLCV